jgi:hypothetical protein
MKREEEVCSAVSALEKDLLILPEPDVPSIAVVSPLIRGVVLLLSLSVPELRRSSAESRSSRSSRSSWSPCCEALDPQKRSTLLRLEGGPFAVVTEERLLLRWRRLRVSRIVPSFIVIGEGSSLSEAAWTGRAVFSGEIPRALLVY